MNDDHVLRKLHALPVLFVVGQEYLLGRSRQFIVGAMQRIMEGLRDFEEIVPPRNYIPVGGNFEFSKQRNETIQHLSHSSTNRSGVDHLHCLPLDFAGKKAQFVKLGRADNCLVVIEVRRRDGSWRGLPGSRSGAPLRTQRRGLSGESRLADWWYPGRRGGELRSRSNFRL